MGLFADLVMRSREAAVVFAVLSPASDPRCAFLNTAMHRLLDAPPERALGTTPLALLTPVLGQGRAAELAAHVERRQSYQGELDTQSGARWLVTGDALPGSRPFYALSFLPTTASEAGDLMAAVSAITREVPYRMRIAADGGLRLSEAGAALARVSGYSVADIAGRGGWPAITDPSDHRVLALRSQRLLAGYPVTAEYRIRRADGQIIWLRDEARPCWAGDGDVIASVVGIWRDMDSEQQLRHYLDARREERTALLKLIDGLLVRVDAAGRIAFVAGEIEGALGDDLLDGEGEPLTDVLTGEARNRWREALERLPANGHPQQFAFQHRIGDEQRWSYGARLLPSQDGGALALIQPAPSTTTR
ncbi:MAG: PAS domain-containing protein [Geminicoccaceae bacterium]